LFTSINFEDLTVADMNNNTVKLDELMKKIHSLNESNNRLLVKYSGDEKYVKIHKRVLERIPEFNQVDLYEILTNLKNEIDDILLRKYDIMDTESYFKQTIMPMTLDEFDKHNITIVIDEVQFFTEVIVETYLAERSLNL
jgi:type I restriction enzyme R subunit